MTSNAVDFVTVSGFRLLVSAVRIRRMWISLEIGGFRFLGSGFRYLVSGIRGNKWISWISLFRQTQPEYCSAYMLRALVIVAGFA